MNSKYEKKEILESTKWRQKLVCGKSSFILSLPSRYFKWQTIKSNMKPVELPETHEKRPDHCSSKQLIRRAILLYCPQECLRLSGVGVGGGAEAQEENAPNCF